MKKAQAGLDFLMTYGWALLLIVLIIGALFALGIFDIGSFLGSRASGFAQVGVSAWRLAPDGTVTVQFENHVGSDIQITSISAVLGIQNINYSTPVDIDNGQRSGTLTLGTFGNPSSAGSSYSIAVDMTYTDLATGFEYGDAGTLTGQVS